MKNTQSLKNKYSDSPVVMANGREFKDIEEEVRKLYESLPQKERAFIPDYDQQIISLTQSIIGYGSAGNVRPKGVFYNIARENRRSEYYGTKIEIFTAFRIQRPTEFAKYNSYMYRRGEKATSYFYQNAKVSPVGGTVWKAELNIPIGGRVPYSKLYIEYDFSNQEILSGQIE